MLIIVKNGALIDEMEGKSYVNTYHQSDAMIIILLG